MPMTAGVRRPNLVVAAFILGSLLLHLLVLLVPGGDLFKPAAAPAPVFVEIRPPERRARELDQPRRPAPPRPRETPARRLAEQDQVVKRETAPVGKDTEDTTRSVRTERPPQASPAPAPTLPAPPAAAGAAAEVPLQQAGDLPVAAAAPPPRSPPSLDQLTTLSPMTLAKLESNWREKLREGVERGDTVWLDTEQDLLISFFKRFRTNIYNVWNYPERARWREEEGTCLLRITVSRAGGIDAVELLESSGSRDLDEEAIRAVRKGAPYGPLPNAYPHPQLNIMGYFSYNLSKTVVRREGWIYR